MKTIIAGSRGITDYKLLERAIADSGFEITEIVSGMCPESPDMLGALYSATKGLPLHPFRADWNKYGRAAGFRCNIEMAKNADALIALWDGKSNGTRHMIERAKERGLKIFVYNLSESNV
jgi:hypothetical protein